MSEYINFYIGSNGQFISLDDFSRSTEIYKAMKRAWLCSLRKSAAGQLGGTSDGR